MKLAVISAFDDLDLTRQPGIRTPAEHSRLIGLGGIWAEVDLSPEHDEVLMSTLVPLMAVGTAPEELPDDPSGRVWQDTYNAGMRAWADVQRPPVEYRKPNGAFSYSRPLRRGFAAFLAENYGKR